MPIALVGLLSATLFCLGLLALLQRSDLSDKALGLGLMAQAGLFYLFGVSYHLGRIDASALVVIGLGLLPLVCLPWRTREQTQGNANIRHPSAEDGR